MIEHTGSIWVHFAMPGHFVCITTNGSIKKSGNAVMGRGNAKQAKLLVPGLEEMLGAYLRRNGNRAGILNLNPLLADSEKLVIFPVKRNWWEKADMSLIRASEFWLRHEAQSHPEAVYHLPRPGCGNGGLKWSQVKLWLKDLPENVWVHSLVGGE